MEGLEPPRLAAPEPKSGVSTNFTTSAQNMPRSFSGWLVASQVLNERG